MPKKKCGTCGGEGEHRGRTFSQYYVDCETCDGTGYISYDKIVKCSTCRGSGKLDGGATCFTCSGHGKLLSGDGSNSGGGCFITTATLLSTNQADDDLFLNTFREFRDTYVKTRNRKLLDEYYIIAPLIVNEIDKDRDRVKQYFSIYTDHLVPIYDAINKNEYSIAEKCYIEMVQDLYARYIEFNK